MNWKSLISPQALPFEYEAWKQEPFHTRVKMLCHAWAIQGYGAPVSVYIFYILKIAFYIGMWIFFCTFSRRYGGRRNRRYWSGITSIFEHIRFLTAA